jgi:hypothetical protein
MARIDVPRGSDASPVIVARGETQVDVVNTTTETNLFSYTIPANTLRGGDRLLIRAAGSIRNASAGAVTYRWRLKLGATTLLDSGTVSIATDANRRRWVFDGELVPVSTAAVHADARMSYSAGSTADWAPSGGNQIGSTLTAAAEDLTADKALVLTVTLGTASANAEQKLESYLIQRVPKALT